MRTFHQYLPYKLGLFYLAYSLLSAPVWADSAIATPPNLAVNTKYQLVIAGSSASSSASSLSVTGHAYQASHSLLGRLLLAMAYDQDPVLSKLSRKQKWIVPFIVADVAAIYGLTLAEGIYISHSGYTQPIPRGTTQTKKRIVIPGNMTIIVGGVGLLSLGGIIWWYYRYDRKIKARQRLIQDQIDRILQQLAQGTDRTIVQGELNSLVGKEAAEEFLSLWQAIHTPSP